MAITFCATNLLIGLFAYVNKHNLQINVFLHMLSQNSSFTQPIAARIDTRNRVRHGLQYAIYMATDTWEE